MGRKKTTIKVPKVVTITCPNCLTKQRSLVNPESTISSFTCKECKQLIRTPITQCCIVCAFSGKKCPYSIKMQAHSKGLELR
ncbi:MAG TPA: hypothetical protein VHA12_00235 [Candidatus Nanoarchaeia archaeon]|nr:hypothetical protein [Candidatus Nanoarchaeia archaeon]